jgi:hypothetical protein
MLCYTNALSFPRLKFTIYLHYPVGTATGLTGSNLKPVTAICKGSLLSARSPQPRYIVSGDKGSYVKFGVDIQENQLKAMKSPFEILGESFGKEPEAAWGILENANEDGDQLTKSM